MGLANYRALMAVLGSEIQRSSRTVRPFAIVLLDLDGLKRINDRHGHLIGSQALRRLADVLSATCRAMDTAARYGGDEFVLVLPQSGEEAALRITARIRSRLAEDFEIPPLTVSAGAAIYPTHRTTIEALLAAADKRLYGMKAGRRYRLVPHWA